MKSDITLVLDDVILLGEIIGDQVPVLVVEGNGGVLFRVVFHVQDGQEVDALLLFIIVTTLHVIDGFHAGRVTHYFYVLVFFIFSPKIIYKMQCTM